MSTASDNNAVSEEGVWDGAVAGTCAVGKEDDLVGEGGIVEDVGFGVGSESEIDKFKTPLVPSFLASSDAAAICPTAVRFGAEPTRAFPSSPSLTSAIRLPTGLLSGVGGMEEEQTLTDDGEREGGRGQGINKGREETMRGDG